MEFMNLRKLLGSLHNVGRKFGPCEDDSQKPECSAGVCLSKPVARDLSVIPPVRVAHKPSSGQRADKGVWQNLQAVNTEHSHVPDI